MRKAIGKAGQGEDADILLQDSWWFDALTQVRGTSVLDHLSIASPTKLYPVSTKRKARLVTLAPQVASILTVIGEPQELKTLCE